MVSPNEILLMLASTQCVASLSPGPNWVLIVQNSMHDRKVGLATAAGVPPAVICFIIVSLMGGSALFALAPSLPVILRIICGCYLAYLGIRSLLSSFGPNHKITGTQLAAPSAKAAFMTGFICSITNPKAIAYYSSIFTATNAFTLPTGYKIAVIFLMPLVSCTCNSSVALMASSSIAKDKLSVLGHWSKRIAGAVMISFGVYMLISL